MNETTKQALRGLAARARKRAGGAGIRTRRNPGPSGAEVDGRGGRPDAAGGLPRGRAAQEGDMSAVADLLARPRRPGPWLRPADTLREAALRLRRLGLSALPVVEGGRILGVITESHLLEAMLGGRAALDRSAAEVMAGRFGTVSPRTPLRELVPLLEASDLAIVAEGPELLGVVTRLDVLEHLRVARN